MAYPDLIGMGDPELLRIKTEGDEIKELEYRTEKHDNGIISKSLKFKMNNKGRN